MKIKKLLNYNLKSLLGFEIIYKLLTTIIFVPLFLTCFKLITNLTGYEYLTLENVGRFLLNPLTIIFLIILLFMLTFYIILDISTVIIIMDSSYQEKKITIKEAFVIALKKAQRVWQKKNFLICFLVLFLIPFLHIGISSGFITTISIPEFILDFIIKNKVLVVVYGIVIVLLLVLLFRWLYALNYFILEDLSFKEARAKSIKLSAKNKLKDFGRIILMQVLIALFYLLFVFFGISLIILVYKLIGKIKIISSLAITIVWLLIAVSFFVISLLSTPISYGMISILYYQKKEQQKEEIKHIKIDNKEKKKINKFVNKLKWALLILVIFSGTLFTYSIMNGKYDLKIEYIRDIEVTAHRGASINYPENTMSAFKGAKDLKADWIELDVQQTKDQKLIVLHDANLKRTTGINKNTWDVNYSEIASLDAGSFFASNFASERIPLLEEVIVFAQENNIKLNIELKPTGHEQDFEKQVVDLINQYNFASNCVVTSQAYDSLEKIKAYDTNIKTIYVMSLAYGDITNLTSADGFSVEASSINKKLVKKVHNAGKEIYAWTINTEANMQKMINLNVDNLITDNITLAKEVIYQSKTSNIINEYIKLINNF